jgi:endonuclease VIII
MRRLVARARALLEANRGTARRTTTPAPMAATGARLWVYGRAGRPCRRCGTVLVARRHGELPRRRTWCPHCQPPGSGMAAG